MGRKAILSPEEAVTAVEGYLRECRRRHDAPRIYKLAEKLHVTPLQLSRAFERASGFTLSSYMKAWQLDRTRDLLLTSNRKIDAISYESGESTRTVYRAIKQAEGLTPSRFRRRKKRNEKNGTPKLK